MIRLVRVVRNVEFTQLFDSFFITSITTILVIRFYLKVTGYPQIGNSALHISHLLPGVLLMLISVILLLGTVNRAARGFAAILAGIGFGFVWDELGKFITQDNDYFFHATPGLIYLTFVSMYLIVRYVAQRRFSQDDYLANVLDLLKDAAIKDLDIREYRHAKELLAHVSTRHPLYETTKQMLEIVKPSPERQPSVLDKIINVFMWPIRTLRRQPFFSTLIVGIAVIYGMISIAAAAFFFAGASLPDNVTVNAFLNGDESDIIGGVSALLSAIFVALAAYNYLIGRAERSYKIFELALLVNIFIGQVVLFFKNQTIALAWLVLTIFLLVNLQLIASEHARAKNSRPPE